MFLLSSLINDFFPISHGALMLDGAAVGIMPALAKIHSVRFAEQLDTFAEIPKRRGVSRSAFEKLFDDFRVGKFLRNVVTFGLDFRVAFALHGLADKEFHLIFSFHWVKIVSIGAIFITLF